MRRAIAVLASVGLQACAAAPPLQLAAPTSSVARLVRQIVLVGTCASCPISPELAYTAGHCVEGAGDLLAWRSWEGEQGLATVFARFDGKDLAMIRSTDRSFPHYSRVATGAPELGDQVVIGTRTHFVLDSPGISVFRGSIFGIHELGPLIIDSPVSPGTSGGCVWNAQGEVIAVATGGLIFTSHPWMRSMQTSVPVWGTKEKS